ncbi:hypothetical protein TNCT_81011 [Trichonephila clavata]|uniref:Uncharacterized protein n=1 Tax=Trichonephila clavata TaxID=2740835 RepID=A0A8X6FQI4_TRICU|nr:hypothetical protein TNCT_81011 [Trichonephila clavata]
MFRAIFPGSLQLTGHSNSERNITNRKYFLHFYLLPSPAATRKCSFFLLRTLSPRASRNIPSYPLLKIPVDPPPFILMENQFIPMVGGRRGGADEEVVTQPLSDISPRPKDSFLSLFHLFSLSPFLRRDRAGYLARESTIIAPPPFPWNKRLEMMSA